MEQDHQERAQDPADAADQYDQPAVTDVQAGNKIGKKENHSPITAFMMKFLMDLRIKNAPKTMTNINTTSPASIILVN